MSRKHKAICHVIALIVESETLLALVFLFCISGRYHNRLYTNSPQEVRFSVKKGQEELLRDLSYFRLDYTTHARRVASDDSDFIARQMVMVARNKEDPYAEYCVALPKDVLKIRINTHYKDGNEHDRPIEMAMVKWRGEVLHDNDFELYYNHAYNFYGKCYIPRSLVHGYYVEYIVSSFLLALAVGLAYYLYFRKREDPR